jgi:hypothetical protein
LITHSGIKRPYDPGCDFANQGHQQNSNKNKVKKIIIEGKTRAGRTFRPSDWAERMSGALSTFGRDHRIRYSPMLQPLIIDGIKCIAIDPKMQDLFPEMYSYIMGWASNNDLIVSEEEEENLGNTTQA